MARPKKQFPPKKEHRITIRMTEDMYFVVAREAERAGLSISDYFRQLALHHKIVYKPPIIHDDRAIIEELKDINKLGNNLNQIARHLNQGGAVTDSMVKELQEALRLITGSCIKINKAVDTGKQAWKFRIDEDGNIRTGNPSAHWLPDVKFTEEIGGTIYTVTGSYKGTDTADQKASRILFQNLKNMEDEQ